MKASGKRVSILPSTLDVAMPTRPYGVNKRERKTRAQKSEEVRNALFEAAAEVVGELGYGEASIARITQRAKLASGTFYYYFESRQDIFDELLPALGEQMVGFIRREAGGRGNFLEKEERSFRAFFRFLAQVPHFLRILNEAEVFAPKAHKRHLENVTVPYLRFLKKYRTLGEVNDLPDGELEPIVYMLIATRAYLAMRFANELTNAKRIENVVSGYMRLVRGGLAKPGRATNSRRPS